MAAKYPADLFMASESGSLGLERDNEYEETPDEDFRTVMSGRNVRRKKRKLREGSFDVEDLTASREESSSEAEPLDNHAIFCTPRSKPPELKLFIRPLDKKRTMKNTNLSVIAKSINSCCGSPPEFIKPTRYGIMVKCTNDKQHKKLKELETIGNTPVTVQEQVFTLKGVISEVPTEMSEMEIQQELQRQKVSNVKRIMRKVSNSKELRKKRPQPHKVYPNA